MVEHDLAKVGVASSSLVSRSKYLTLGGLAEWPCTGLQIRLPRFDSGTRLHLAIIKFHSARVVKLVDTRDLKSLGVRAVRVRVPPWAPTISLLLDYPAVAACAPFGAVAARLPNANHKQARHLDECQSVKAITAQGRVMDVSSQAALALLPGRGRYEYVPVRL